MSGIISSDQVREAAKEYITEMLGDDLPVWMDSSAGCIVFIPGTDQQWDFDSRQEAWEWFRSERLIEQAIPDLDALL